MREEQKNFFDIMHSFRKLNLSSMLPGISHGELGVLKMIQHCQRCSGVDQGGVKVSLIVKEMHLPPPAISRALRVLEEKELVLRDVDKKDRRNTFVKVTEKGIARIAEADCIMEEFSDAVFGNLGADTLQKLNDYLQKFVETSKIEIEKRKYNEKKGESE